MGKENPGGVFPDQGGPQRSARHSAWGDMVLVLGGGAGLEMRSMPRFRDVEAYILERMTPERRRPPTSRSKVSPPESAVRAHWHHNVTNHGFLNVIGYISATC